MTIFEYSVELSLSLLLCAGIFCSIHIVRSLATLRRDRSELMRLIAQLDESGRQAEDGIEKLQVAGDVSARTLNRMIEQSRLVCSELSSMAEKGEILAERIEILLRKEKKTTETENEFYAEKSVQNIENIIRKNHSPKNSKTQNTSTLPIPPRKVRNATERDLIRTFRTV